MRHAILWILIGGLTFGCASSPPEPKSIKLALSSGTNLNPQLDGSAQSVDLLVFHLASANKFLESDLLSVYPVSRAAELLGADLLGSQLIRVAPGVQINQQIDFNPNSQYIGFVVGFEQYQRAQWRSLVKLRDENTLDRVLFRNKKLKVILEDLQVNSVLE